MLRQAGSPALRALLRSSSKLEGPSSQAASTAKPCCSALPQRCPRPRRLTSSAATRSSWPVSLGSADLTDSSIPSSSSSGGQERRSTRLQQSGHIDRTDAGTSKARGKLEMPKSKPAKTILHLQEMKARGIPIACLTAYDYPTALSLRHSEIDLCLVGDSLANVALGHSSTQSLTLDATVHHCQAVHRGLFSPVLSMSNHTPGAPLLIADIPFGTFQTSIEEGVRSAIRILKEGGADGVKIEGGKEILPLVKRLTDFGIPVMGHIGLQPQRVASTAGYRLQGRTADEAMVILEEALALQEAGAFSIVLECIPNRVGQLISQHLQIPTIGIGAGPDCDGQILVTNDMLGELTSPWHVVVGLEESSPLSSSSTTNSLPRLSSPAPSGPKFVRNFVQEVIDQAAASLSTAQVASTDESLPKPGASQGFGLGALRLAAVESYVQAVRQRSFPDPDREGYKMKSAEWKELVAKVEAVKGAGEVVIEGRVEP